MARTVYPTLSEMAESILNDVRAENTIKTAEAQVLTASLAPEKVKASSELTESMYKLANLLRSTPTAGLTYNDVWEYIDAV